MSNEYFFAQDQAGNAHKVHVARHADKDQDARGAGDTPPESPGYALEDGSPVRRIDNDTFQVAGTGAFITLVRE